MNRKTKNIILIIVLIVAFACIVGTIWYGSSHIEVSSNASEITTNMPSDISSGEMADGGFAGAGEASTTSTLTLTSSYIIIITIFSIVISGVVIYLLMSKFNKDKAFINSSKVIIFILSIIILTTILDVIIVYIANNYILNNSDSSSSVIYSSTDDLHINMDNFSYDSANNVYYQIGIVYVSDPATVEYESLGIYIPGDYLDCEKNSTGYYSCTVNEDATVNGYTALTAPIVMPVNTAGYSAQASPTSYSYNGLSDYLEAGFIYVYAGMRGRNNGDGYDGGAPWGVTDLKAAVRYLRYNSDSLPGDTDSIFVFGHSGGGAQSSIIGASGDSELYLEYLETIGALIYDDDGNYISDAIAGVMAWCPITSLDTANEAYEWNMGQYMTTGTRASTTWTSALSEDLAVAYAEYINEILLTDEAGNELTLTSTTDGIYTSGTYYDYILSVIEESLSNYLNDNYSTVSEMQSYVDSLNANGDWVTFNSSTKTVTISSIEDFVTRYKNASKDVGAFDDLNRTQAENAVFGNSENDYLHFDQIMYNLLKNNASKYSLYSDYNSSFLDDFEEDLQNTDSLGNDTYTRQNMYNPMYYIDDYYDGYGTSNVAKYWRIRTGINQSDTALTVEANLYLALKELTGVDVDFATVWGQGHTTAERTGDSTTNFIEWVEECTKA